MCWNSFISESFAHINTVHTRLTTSSLIPSSCQNECNNAFVFYLVQLAWHDHIQLLFRKLLVLFKNTVLNLNIFPLRHFGSRVSKDTAKRLGQWTTRLYIAALLVCLVWFSLYIIVQPQVLTKTFDEPSFDLYQSLKQQYGDQLECPCSNISSTYRGMVTIQPLFHQVGRIYC